MPVDTKPRKSGYNINLASEFHVLSALYRLGLDANETLGNKKAVDIVVVRAPGDTVTIDVKAVAGRVDWLVGNPEAVPRTNHFVALVSHEGKFEDVSTTPSVWIVPHERFLPLVRYAKTPSLVRYVSRKEVVETCSDYRNAWGLLGVASVS
ncbi:MAG: hypothetical protein ABIT38_02665 [Gemmatimonadaceae bacterium]